MDFVKKNWANILMATLSLVGAIFAIVYLAALSDIFDGESNSFQMMSNAIGFMIFFLGLLAFFVCKMLPVSKKITAAILMATGLLASIFLIIFLAELADSTSDWPSSMSSERNAQIMPALVYLFAFGLLPLVAGAKMLCACFCKKDADAKK